MMKYRFWSDEELKILRSEYSQAKVEELARKLGRNRHSVIHKARKLGLKHSRWWTQDEEKTLKKLYPIMSAKEVAQKLGRSTNSIHSRAQKLKLANRWRKRSFLRKGKPTEWKKWTPEEDATIRELYPKGFRSQELADMLGRTKNVIMLRAFKLGVKSSLYRDNRTKGLKGEDKAKGFFIRHGWKIIKKGDAHSPYDFVVKTDKEYLVNVKFGEACMVSSKNLERMFKQQTGNQGVAIFYITNDNRYFWLIVHACKEPQ